MNQRIRFPMFAIASLISATSFAQVPTKLLNLEPERVSPTPDMAAKKVRKDLPEPKDENDTRDVFLYIDGGHLQGRAMHLRIPKQYVSLTGRAPDRHASVLHFSMIWPDLKSSTDPGVIDAMKRNGGVVLEDQIEVSVEPKSLENLLYSTSRLFAHMQYAKFIAHQFKYMDIDPIDGFTQGLRETNEAIKKRSGFEIKDYYIQWLVYEQPEKFMMCRSSDPRPYCELSTYDNSPKSVYGLTLRFHSKLLPHVSALVKAVTSKVDSFVVKVYPANYRGSE